MYISRKINGEPFPGFMPKTFVALLFLIITIHSSEAQIADDFSDGDFTANPVWKGTTGDFIVNAKSQLQLNADVAGTSYLYVEYPEAEIGDLEWQFYVKQSFSPSGGNFGRFYLMSDAPDLTGPLNGYYLQFGEPGSADAVELFRQSGSSSVSVCRGTRGQISSSFSIRMKVIRTHDGLWSISADYAGGDDFSLEGEGIDVAYTSGQFMGIVCTYTVSNAAKFYYDDISVTKLVVPDTTPPTLQSIELVSSRSLRVIFSESVDSVTATDPLNYYCPSLSAAPSRATLQEDQRTVDLSFPFAFQNGIESTLEVRNIRDVSGNVMSPAALAFLYFEPSPVETGDVIITEVLADPAPQVALPAAEFVELYNRSPNPIQLSDWSLSDGASTATLSSHILLPGTYLILCAAAAEEEFNGWGPVEGLANFPTLNNAGDSLRLLDAQGRTIDSVYYSVAWFRDSDKAEGGWSLELIDPENMCEEEANWSASEAASGGTPGEQNSVFARKPDNTGPKLVSAIPANDTTLLVVFNEKLDKAVPSVENFRIEPPCDVASVSFAEATSMMLILSLAQPIKAGTTYRLTVSNVFDCPGNRIQDEFSHAGFVLPQEALPGDIVINEILPNPRPTGVDFVEVLNRSDKTIDLQGWSLRNWENAEARRSKVIADGLFILRPGEYRVFTENSNVLKGEYVMGVQENFVEMELPSFNDEAGAVALVDTTGLVIDSMYYDAGFHSSFVSDAEGISLERISPDAPAVPANWKSASSQARFATPGYRNSNARMDTGTQDGVTVEPEVIQPESGQADFARIRYRFRNGGLVANVIILDQQGHTVRQVARNELLGTDGFFRWDGERDDGSRARTGYYMIRFEVFDAGGELQIYKRRIAVF